MPRSAVDRPSSAGESTPLTVRSIFPEDGTSKIMSSSTTTIPPILRGIHATPSGASLLHQILTSKILLVGSGGIGCELLKNLALSGFRDVEVIDLDTIDVSNLNRQFLFRSRHVGMAKCVVATEAALRMVPPLILEDDGLVDGKDGNETMKGVKDVASYTPHHGNVCDNAKFNVPYVQSFSLVLNALDNVAARRRVNRLCLAASVPLIEAGTAGYLGQVTVIDKPSGTECYECQAKATQKVYPICTIRSTPSMPVHCIVWGKELYKLCFGPKVEESMLFEDEASLRAEREATENGDEGDNNHDSKETNGKDSNKEDSENRMDALEREQGGEKSTYMEHINNLRQLMRIGSPDDSNYELDASKLRSSISSDEIPPTEKDTYQPTQLWSRVECILELTSCFLQIARSTRGGDNGGTQPPPEFDKDDPLAMRFVTAASNLRSYIFQIDPIQSLYSAKGIAGNMMPAIATTNAIVAGLQILQAFHVLRSRLLEGDAKNDLKEVCRYIYCLRDMTRKGYYLQPTKLPDPNPECFVCRNAVISLVLNTNEWNLEMLLSRVIKKELGFAEPTLMVGGDIVYEEGDDIDPSEYSGNLSKKLVDLPSGGVGHGSVIRVEDFTQDLEVEISVSHRDYWVIKDEDGKGKVKEDDREEIEKFDIGGSKPTVATASKGEGANVGAAAGTSETNGDKLEKINEVDGDIKVVDEKPRTKDDGGTNASGKIVDDDDYIEVVDADLAQNGSRSSKKRSREEDNGTDTKKSKVEFEVIEID
ncbi:hypothetical protein ACHAXS_002309 [Conticribra weissflogii]